MAALLLDRGAEVEAADSGGRRALHEAALNPNPAVARLLLERGAEVNAADASGRRALHEAALNPNPAVAALLLDRGAEVEAADSSGRRALHAAALNPNPAVAGLLLERGAEAGIEDDGQATPLLLAWLNSRSAVAARLLRSGAAQAALNDRLLDVEWMANATSAQLLAQVASALPSDLLREDHCGRSPIHLVAHFAARNNIDPRIAELDPLVSQAGILRFDHFNAGFRALLERGASIRAKDGRGNSVLHYAVSGAAKVAIASEGQAFPSAGMGLLRELRRLGADFRARGELDLWPVHYAQPGRAFESGANSRLASAISEAFGTVGNVDPATGVLGGSFEPSTALCVLVGASTERTAPGELLAGNGAAPSGFQQPATPSGQTRSASGPKAGDSWTNSFGMEFVGIPAGSFVMGSPADEEDRRDDERQHEVRISEGFWMGKFEVTHEEWEAVMGKSFRTSLCGAECPVDQVSWYAAQEYIRRLNAQETGKGYRYRLPTEAEWEYAARAGTLGARYGELDEIAWYRQEQQGTYNTSPSFLPALKFRPGGEKRANAWGLHDMLGNVAEWTGDWHGEYPSGSVTDPAGPAWGSSRRIVRGGTTSSSVVWARRPGRVVRGGSWVSGANFARSAARFGALPEEIRPELKVNNSRHMLFSLGFRLVRTAGSLPPSGGSGAPPPAAATTWTNSLGMEFAGVPAGSFVMGSPADELGRHPGEWQREVRISKGFWMGKYEVTQREWEAVMGSNPSHHQACPRCPVEQVSWHEVQEFIGRLNERVAGRGYYRLPTEAEWEYAARAGTTGAFYGNFYRKLDEIAWYGTAESQPHPVGQKRANAWGLHDMLGNVFEWTGDWGATYPSGAAIDPTGPDLGVNDGGIEWFDWVRVARGGAFNSNFLDSRSAKRQGTWPMARRYDLGFRLVRTYYPDPADGSRRQAAAATWTNSLGMEFVEIAAGSFLMGGREFLMGGGNRYGVRISEGFWMGKYEVTQGEWEVVMGSNPSSHQACPRCPVETVSWHEAQEYIRRLNEREAGSGYAYRLPTEAEWEYAARAGTSAPHAPIYGERDEIHWYWGNSGGRTHPVGQKRANAWGLHDMLGNVWEWTGDWYHRGAYPIAWHVAVDPTGPSVGGMRVRRGGAFSGVIYPSIPGRERWIPSAKLPSTGFRLVRTVERAQDSGTGGFVPPEIEVARRETEESWTNTLGMEFEWIPAGSFVMGSPEDEEGRASDERQHVVRISEGFWMGKYEVTWEEWEAVTGGDLVDNEVSPSARVDCWRCPVSRSHHPRSFIRMLNEREAGSGYVYRLPTEAEWEYAARAGTTGARYGKLDEIAWHRGNAETEIWEKGLNLRSMPVGQKQANAWGLHDMLGNAWEWTGDWYGEYPSGPVTDPAGPSVAVVGPYRVFRGGSATSGAENARSARRAAFSNRPGFFYAGFRLVRTESLPDIEMEFEWIPAGTFMMGSPEDEEGHDSDERQREVRISEGFWMGKYEVTQGEWEAVMQTNPSRFQECGALCPVEQVTWHAAQEFIRRLNERKAGSGYLYRLPTEAEWEYAARAGTTGARYGKLDEIAWHGSNSYVNTRPVLLGSRTTHPVGQKRANAWGLHDMLGNVFEWTGDWYGPYNSALVRDPAGPSTGSERVFRGGSWRWSSRAAERWREEPTDWDSFNIGFRVVRTVAKPPGMKFNWIPPTPRGFYMGDSDEGRHFVRLSEGFWMGQHEVTQGEWEAVMGENPSRFQECGALCPVEQVTWNEVQEYIRRLNEREAGSGFAYRLPTEAEWEWAASGGTWAIHLHRLGDYPVDEIAWYAGNSDGRTHPGGQKLANEFGLYDMRGNVWEWTGDWYGEYPYDAHERVTDPAGPSTGLERVIRGGSWSDSAQDVRHTRRGASPPDSLDGTSSIGFRLVRVESGG